MSGADWTATKESLLRKVLRTRQFSTRFTFWRPESVKLLKDSNRRNMQFSCSVIYVPAHE
jgi:hypothetical protein